jgi:hypothetical protein
MTNVMTAANQAGQKLLSHICSLCSQLTCPYNADAVQFNMMKSFYLLASHHKSLAVRHIRDPHSNAAFVGGHVLLVFLIVKLQVM